MSREKKKKRKMFVGVLPGEQVEVVLAEDGKVQEYYIEMLHQAKTKGNIYNGVVSNIDHSLQAAFVNYGAPKNGFLQIDEVHSEYYFAPHDAVKGHKYPLIQKVLKSGQEILVQVVKEPTGAKGAFLTTYFSLPGRFLVLTPGHKQIGVSRKVEDDEERARLKGLVDSLESEIEEELGIIVRTASLGQNKTSLSKDLQFLKRLWREIRKMGSTMVPPALVYQEPDLATRAIRDYLTVDVGEVWVDDQEIADRLIQFANLIFPRQPNLVKVHKALERTLWERFNLTRQLEQIFGREVTLPSGGGLIFDQTEALMAIDINSGKVGGKVNFNEMALRINLEAAEVVAQQLRLRDVGGQIVIDFIEMKDRKHVHEVEKTLRAAMKVDRARHDIGKMSKFGLVEIVRQRLGSSALSITIESCPCCGGAGTRRNKEWQAQQALQEIYRQLRIRPDKSVEYRTNGEIAYYLLNTKRAKLLELERQFETAITILAS
ncbi:Ribonuclease [Desulfovibrionales bacterium]